MALLKCQGPVASSNVPGPGLVSCDYFNVVYNPLGSARRLLFPSISQSQLTRLQERT